MRQKASDFDRQFFWIVSVPSDVDLDPDPHSFEWLGTGSLLGMRIRIMEIGQKLQINLLSAFKKRFWSFVCNF
jgi:hypothetical protein